MYNVVTESASWAGHTTEVAAIKDAAERNAVHIAEGGTGAPFYVVRY